MIYITNKETKKIVFCKEKLLESVISDLVTFLMTVSLLYMTKNYLGNSWLALAMMAITYFSIIHKRKNTVDKREFMEIVKKELNDEI